MSAGQNTPIPDTPRKRPVVRKVTNKDYTVKWAGEDTATVLASDAAYTWQPSEKFAFRDWPIDVNKSITLLPADKRPNYLAPATDEHPRVKQYRTASNIVAAPTSVLRSGASRCAPCISRCDIKGQLAAFGCISGSASDARACAECRALGANNCDLATMEEDETKAVAVEAAMVVAGLDSLRTVCSTLPVPEGSADYRPMLVSLVDQTLTQARNVTALLNSSTGELVGMDEPPHRKRRKQNPDEYEGVTLATTDMLGSQRQLRSRAGPSRSGPGPAAGAG